MALAVACAARVGAGDFRTLGSQSGLLRPLVWGKFQARSTPGRKARDWKKRHGWRFGVKLGPRASGEVSQRTYDLDATPLGIRDAGLREATGVIRCKGQVGYPPSVATDALLGFSAMAYQSAELSFGRREGSGRYLARFEGTRTRAHGTGEEAEMARGADVG